jgi:aspartate aminotransferase-like enzyme
MRDLTIRRTAGIATLASDRAHASATVSALTPAVSAEALKGAMKKRGFTIGGGYGKWKDSTFRIGHMGDISVNDVEVMLDALEEAAQELAKTA